MAGAEAVRRRLPPPHRHNRRYRAAKAFAVGRPVADRHGDLGVITDGRPRLGWSSVDVVAVLVVCRLASERPVKGQAGQQKVRDYSISLSLHVVERPIHHLRRPFESKRYCLLLR
jgi:hypothetical protein